MTQLGPFFILLFAGLFSAEVFSKLHLPWVVTLILGGILVGPHGLDIFTPTATIEFIAEIGLIFLMFMAGLETKLESVKSEFKSEGLLIGLNILFPFSVGIGVAKYFNYSWQAAILLGIIFISSSVAIVIPSLQAKRLLGTSIGKSIISLTVIKDVTSLIMLSLLLQSLSPTTSLPLPVFYAFLFAMLVFLRWAIPNTRSWFVHRIKGSQDIFQKEIRSILFILIGTSITFELLGLHPIVAGFFAGLVLSDSVSSDILKEKLRTISYGLFIPTFFIIIGTKTDLSVVGSLSGMLFFSISVVFSSIIGQFASAWLGSKLSGFNKMDSAVIAAAAIPQLSTTLAAAFTGFELGIIDRAMITALVLLSLISTIVSPLLLNVLISSSPKYDLITTLKDKAKLTP